MFCAGVPIEFVFLKLVIVAWCWGHLFDSRNLLRRLAFQRRPLQQRVGSIAVDRDGWLPDLLA